MKVIVAARLSQARSAQTGIDTQDVDARAWAERNGHEVVATVADRISGRVAPFHRPNLGPWLTDPALVGQYQGIVVAKIDRLSRGRDWGTRQWAEDHAKVLLVVSPELRWPPLPGDTATPIIWDTLMNVSSAEWDNTSQRYRRMQQALRDGGYLVGRTKFGYRIVKSGDHKTLLPDEITAPYVRTMADKYLAGESLRDIADWMEGETGKRWSAKFVQQILRNPIYAGRRQDAKGRTVLKVEPIIDRETWEAVQAALDRKATRKGIVPGNTALLTNVAYCYWCDGGPMYRLRSTTKRKDGSKHTILYYRCHGSEGRSKCKNMVRLSELDDFVNLAFDPVPADEPEGLYWSAFGHLEVIETVVVKGHGHEDELAENSHDIRDLDPDDPEYDGKLAALRTERKRLQALPMVPDVVEERPTGITVAKLWRSLNTQERRDYLVRAGVKVIVAGKRGPEHGLAPYWLTGDPHKVMGTVTGQH